MTIGAVGFKDGARWVMGTFSDGGVVLGEPQDFTVPGKRQARNAGATASDKGVKVGAQESSSSSSIAGRLAPLPGDEP